MRAFSPCPIPALVFLALFLVALIKTIFLSRHTYCAPWPQYRTLAASANRSNSLMTVGLEVPSFNFPQKALWFPESNGWHPSMCGRGPWRGGEALGKLRGTGQWPKAGLEVGGTPLSGAHMSRAKRCVCQARLVPGGAGEQPPCFACAYNEEMPKGMCITSCACYVCTRCTVCMHVTLHACYTSLIFLHYVCCVRVIHTHACCIHVFHVHCVHDMLCTWIILHVHIIYITHAHYVCCE